MSIKLLTEPHLGFLTLKGGCTGLSESIHVKMPHCWKSHVAAHCYYDERWQCSNGPEHLKAKKILVLSRLGIFQSRALVSKKFAALCGLIAKFHGRIYIDSSGAIC